MKATKGQLTLRDCTDFIKGYWDPKTADNVRNMKECSDGCTVIFDVFSNRYEGFMAGWSIIKHDPGNRVDFTVSKCNQLPQFENKSMSWRDNKGGAKERDYTGRGGGFGG